MSSAVTAASNPALGDDELALSTERSGDDELLESMFTERTTTSEGDRDELVVPEGTDHADHVDHELDYVDNTTDNSDDCHPETEPIDASAHQILDPAEQHDDAAISLVENADAAGPLTSDARSTPDSNCSHSSATQSPAERQTPLRVVSFDVGGKLFRCKESLIRQHPRKRLYQVITCGCERISQNTFFVDRNPQHFEVILDWYRTGLYVRHPHVDEIALQEDAKYFDLYEELFPEKILPPPRVGRQPVGTSSLGQDAGIASPLHRQEAPRIPPRPPREQPPIPTSPEKNWFAESSTACVDSDVDSTTAANTTGADILCFSRTEQRIVAVDAAPVVFMLRENDRLLVASVAGRGKLLVRVCDATGMQAVLVETAVLFDSQSWFYLKGGRAKLEHCLLPGSHTYTFWMERIGEKATSKSASPASTQHTQHKIDKPELDVEFKIISSFRADEQCPEPLDAEFQALVVSQSATGVFPRSATRSGREGTASTSCSPYMFLPLQLHQYNQEQQHYPQQLEVSHPDEAPQEQVEVNARYSDSKVGAAKRSKFDAAQQMKDRDAIAKQLFGQESASVNQVAPSSGKSTTTPTASPTVAFNIESKTAIPIGSSRYSAIKRGGVAVVSGSGDSKASGGNSSNSRNKDKGDASSSELAGRITVYRAAQLKIEDSPRGSPQNSSPCDAAGKPRESTHPTGVVTKCHDHQPRLFR